jgi:hypothetical protein
MLFTGRTKHTYVYDPDRGDWDGRFEKPASMAYGSCFYTLTLCTTPTGLIAWTQGGELLRFEPDGPAWKPLLLSGEKLPGSIVDNSTLTYDSERNRLLFVRKEYGDDRQFDGEIHAVDLLTNIVSKLSPKNARHAHAIPYLCQLRYDPVNDIVLVGGTLPPDVDGIRRTPAYDCLTNNWISLRIAGDDPSGPKGRNVSLGLVFDERRGLFWAVDTNSEVYVLKLLTGRADRKLLE